MADINQLNPSLLSFSKQLGFKPRKEEPQGTPSGIWEEVKAKASEAWTNTKICFEEATVQNDARKEASKWFHAFEDGTAKKDDARYKNLDFNNLTPPPASQNTSTVNPEKTPNSTAPAQAKDEKSEKPHENMEKLKTAMKDYSTFLFNSGKNKNIRQETQKFFSNLLALLPEGHKNKPEAKQALSNIIEQASGIINKTHFSSYEADGIQSYFEACDKFVNLIFSSIKENEATPNTPEQDVLKSFTLNFVFCSGLMLIYQKRSTEEKACVVAKRLFVVIGYVMHELAGVFLQLYVNPYIAVAATATGGPFAVIFFLTLFTGFLVVTLVEIIIDGALGAAEELSARKLEQDLYDMKKFFEFANIGERPKDITDGFMKRWSEHIGEELTEKLDAFASFFRNKLTYLSKLSEIENNEKDIFNSVNSTAIRIPHDFDKKMLFNTSIKSLELASYIHNSQQALSDNDKYLIDELMFRQNEYSNASQELSEKEKRALKKNLEALYADIAKKIVANIYKDPHAATEEQKAKLTLFVQYRLEAFSQLLTCNFKHLCHKALNGTDIILFGAADAGADSLGVTITTAVQTYGLNPITEMLYSCGLTLAGAIPVVGAGIFLHFFLKGLSKSYDKSHIEKPNEKIKAYVDQYKARLNQHALPA